MYGGMGVYIRHTTTTNQGTSLNPTELCLEPRNAPIYHALRIDPSDRW